MIAIARVLNVKPFDLSISNGVKEIRGIATLITLEIKPGVITRTIVPVSTGYRDF